MHQKAKDFRTIYWTRPSSGIWWPHIIQRMGNIRRIKSTTQKQSKTQFVSFYVAARWWWTRSKASHKGKERRPGEAHQSQMWHLNHDKLVGEENNHHSRNNTVDKVQMTKGRKLGEIFSESKMASVSWREPWGSEVRSRRVQTRAAINGRYQ